VAVRSEVARRQSDFLLEHREFVARLCRILLRDAEESEDASQQVFLNAYQALGEGVTPLNARAWLAQIARNECRSRVRRVAAHPEAPLRETLPNGDLDPAEAAEQRALIARLRRELAALPERQREALLLREFRGLSYEELAAAMDETGPAVESLLQRARRRLVSRLEEARRPFVSATLVVDWIRNAVSRLSPGPAATEAVATGGAAAVVAKLAAAGVVAVGVGVAGDDVTATRQAPLVPAASEQRASVGARPAHRSSVVIARGSRGRSGLTEHSGRGRRDGPSGRPAEAESARGPGGMPFGTSSGGSDSNGPGPGPSEVTTSEPNGSGSGESGSTSSTSGPSGGSNSTSASGPSDRSGSDSSGSSGSGSSGSGSGSPEPSGSDSGGSGSSGSGSSGSGSDGYSGSGSPDSSAHDD